MSVRVCDSMKEFLVVYHKGKRSVAEESFREVLEQATELNEHFIMDKALFVNTNRMNVNDVQGTRFEYVFKLNDIPDKKWDALRKLLASPTIIEWNVGELEVKVIEAKSGYPLHHLMKERG